ncbi:GntR family transcriptional regulator [Virgibacillus alimentarius]|uniref:DNA-binding GntR family transcriptional regulator n=1 Tax=Virgibacillus alimentarius TaxID=698769 RepID=A0ABS4S9J7_9BACI|nr:MULTISPECIES: GntR family transcriptional regulator [Virgibacillus]MBP2258165.1 DNA-binding GntR family transcriptional regulator [Virgibacillus alimentarius]HLR69326.1 GntR family transcriptional regulator [Virgibacillus sp.]
MSELNFGKPIKKETVYEIAYRELKSAILSNKLNQNQFYTEEDFANELGISRTPVREAIQGLVYDRLLIAVPRKGVKVRGFTNSEINQIFLLRKAIEKEVLTEFLKTVTNEQINRLEEIISQQDKAIIHENRELFIQLDQEFHNCIIHYTNYNLVEEIYSKLHDLTVLIGYQAIRKEGRMNEVITEHKDIVQAIVEKNKEQASAKLLLHLDNTMDSYKIMDNK